MDFTFTEEQEAVREAAAGVFAGLVNPERVTEIESTDDRIDRALWEALAAADLLGTGEMGLTEVCLLLEEQGKVVAPVPLWATLALGALPLARLGPDKLKAEWLPEVAAGRAVLTGAVTTAARAIDGMPVITATPDGEGFRLDGTELAVPQAHVAARVLVPARTDGGDVVVALVDPAAPGVEVERAVTTNREVHPHLHLAGTRVDPEDVVGGREVLHLMLLSGMTGLCALAVGVAESALRQTAEYLNQREQFGKPLATFQGALLRAGDAAIDLEAMRVTLWQAAWRIDTGRDARWAVPAAKWQASERGQRIVHSTQHLHGGIGADVTYPIHRYFLWGKQVELMLGSGSAQLARLGSLIAHQAKQKAGA